MPSYGKEDPRKQINLYVSMPDLMDYCEVQQEGRRAGGCDLRAGTSGLFTQMLLGIACFVLSIRKAPLERGPYQLHLENIQIL